MRIRSVKPDFFTDRVTGRWSFELMIFYEALWCLADDEGRFEWEPDAIVGRLFPFKKDLDAAGLLEQLVQADRALRYEVGGASYGVLLKFKKHQKPNRTVPSKLPPPPSTVEAVIEQGGLTPVEERRGEESSGEGEENEPAGDERRPRKRPPADPRVSPLTATLVAAYRDLRGTKYKHGGAKDAQALKSLLAVANEEAILGRWKVALVASGWTRCNTFAQLGSKWNDLAVSARDKPTSDVSRKIVGRDPETGRAIYEDQR